MFLGRKPRPQDDEPLVPHGLISQALELPQTPESVAPSQPKPPTPAVVRIKRPPAQILRWPESARKIREGMGALSAFSTSAVSKGIRQTREHFQISRYMVPVRNFGSRSAKRFIQALGVARVIPVELRKLRGSVHFSANVARFRKSTAIGANRLSLMCRTWGQYAATHFQRLNAEGSRALKEIRTRVRTQGNPAVSGTQVRIQLSGIPLRMRIALARANSAWAMRRNSLSRNSQVWTPLALGVICSLMVMSIFSIARHYAKASLPSSRAANVSSVQASTAAVPGTVPIASHPLKPISENQTIQHASARLKPKPHESRPATATPRKRIHRNEDEDYVAKDTYVYYGRNPLRQAKPAKD
jgi:hypothetical protein